MVNHGLLAAVNMESFNLQVNTFIDEKCPNYCRITNNCACGNGVVDPNEICDNGNKPGCSANCVPDNGYICSGVFGTTSYCYPNILCGNRVVDNGE